MPKIVLFSSDINEVSYYLSVIKIVDSGTIILIYAKLYSRLKTTLLFIHYYLFDDATKKSFK